MNHLRLLRCLLRLARLIALSVVAVCCGVQAQPVPDAPPGTLDDDTCIEVEVNGVTAPSYGCLTLKLKPKPVPVPVPGTQAAGAPPPALGSESIVQKPGNQLGLFNRAATSHRMGNAFGNSVVPQRPAR
ncbi:MAG: hypothetical protein EOP81_01550 [Variovorax sp.]|nr:MAG: hypothetical protein EOP81_01550 [Variovorax sp.]